MGNPNHDARGRFSSGGGGGGRSSSSPAKRLAGGVSGQKSSRLGLERKGNKVSVARDTQVFGSKRSGNKVTGTSVSKEVSSGKTERTGSYLYGANKVMGSTVRRKR